MSIHFQWEKIGKKQPLVHQITNYVTVNDCANITLAAGGIQSWLTLLRKSKK